MLTSSLTYSALTVRSISSSELPVPTSSRAILNPCARRWVSALFYTWAGALVALLVILIARRREHTHSEGQLGTWLDAPVARLDHPRHGDPRIAVGNRDERDLPIPHAAEELSPMMRRPPPYHAPETVLGLPAVADRPV